MNKNNLQRTKNGKSIPRTSLNGMRTFAQLPSQYKHGLKEDAGRAQNASDLFSQFTADIIKADVPFTR